MAETKGTGIEDFGLSPDDLKEIKRVFQKYPQITKVKVFGSRALGNSKSNSDIDLALWGQISQKLLVKITVDLDELSTPYLFDVKVYDDIDYQPLKDHIDKFGKCFYQKPKEK